jgi:hypothetical protein
MIDLRNVSLGLPLFLLPDGNQNKDCSGILVSFILSTWPKYDQCLFLMMFEMYSCLLSFHTTLLVLKSLHLMFSINRKHLFSKLFNFCSKKRENFQHSQPYINTGNTRELNNLNFVLALNIFDDQIFFLI